MHNKSYVPYLYDLITPMHLFYVSVTDEVAYGEMIDDNHNACSTQPNI